VRRAFGVPPPGRRSLFLHGADIGRTADGRFAVFADRTQAPSGVGYALADRRVISRALPRAFRTNSPRPLSGFAQILRQSLLECAPPGVDDPTVVVLSPGALSETAFDQAYLASVLGFPLVEAADLAVRGGGLYMRSLGRMKRVDVVLRRVDSEFADPLDLRTDSRLGVVGLVELMSRGAVSVVNTLGSGVLENPALHAFLPRLCRALLEEDLLLASTPTHYLGDGLNALDGDPDRLLLTNFSTGEQVTPGDLAAADRAELRARIAAQPGFWCAKELVDFSLAPTISGDCRPRPFGMRTFSVAHDSGYAVLGGGMGQVLADGAAGTMMVSVAAKDVWVPISEDTRASVRVATVAPTQRPALTTSSPVATPRVLSDLFWMGRYAERAEAMVRMLSVARERNQEYRNRPWQMGASSLQPWLDTVVDVSRTRSLGLLRAEGPEQSDVVARLRELTLDGRTPGTVANSAERLLLIARAVRDQMSTDTWIVLGGAERALARLAAVVADDGERLDQTLGEVLVSLLAFAGLARESMVQDPAWRMMDTGRRIERALQLAELTTRVLVPVRDPETEAGLIDAYLVACESAVTYRRRHPALIRVGAVVDLMFFDPSNPRSMIFQLDALRADLAGLPDELRSAPVERAVEEQIGRLHRFVIEDAELAEDGRRTELDALVAGTASALREVSTTLERTRFAPPAQMRPLWLGGM
jgi:uncharacterized circularly permuted ATP-grasp superfamily protein/uncharacterized alpha-E superfamily protein